MDIASVGATINIMLAAVRAEGVTTIDNAAKEPEMVNVATFFKTIWVLKYGAHIVKLKLLVFQSYLDVFIEVIPDRI